MSQYLKLFSYYSIFFGILMGVFYTIEYGLLEGLFTGLFSGLLFGTFTSLFTRYLHRKEIKQMGFEISNKTMDPHQTREFDLNIPYNKAYDFCLQSMQSIKKGRIKTEDRSRGLIDARTGIKWNRNPCVVAFKLNKIDNKRTHIEVSSKPSISTAIVDLGTSLENIKIISDYLEGHENRFLTCGCSNRKSFKGALPS